MGLLAASDVSMLHNILYTNQYLVLELVKLVVGPILDILILSQANTVSSCSIIWWIPPIGGGSSRISSIHIVCGGVSPK